MSTFDSFLKSSGINPNSSRAKVLKAQQINSGSPYIEEHENMAGYSLKRTDKEFPDLNKNMSALNRWIIENAGQYLSPSGMFRHSSNPDAPDTLHISKGEPSIFIEEALHAEQYKNLSPAQKDSLQNVNLRELEDLGMMEQYSTPGTVESVHATEGPGYHEKYNEATTSDLGSFLSWFKNKWYNYNRPKHKLKGH